MKLWILTALLGHILTNQVVSQSPPRSNELVIRDGAGRVRLRVGMLVHGVDAPGIELFDEAGKKRAKFALAEDGTPSLMMNDRDGGRLLALERSQDDELGSLSMIGRTSTGTSFRQLCLEVDSAPEADLMRTLARLQLVDRKMNATELPAAR